ncbi:P protein, partial [Danaus plexippus plexippus]
SLSLGWTALLGALLLLLLSEREDLEPVLARVEWSTLLFFAALFVMMEVLSKLGLIAWIGRMTETVISQVGEDSRLAVAVMLILWGNQSDVLELLTASDVSDRNIVTAMVERSEKLKAMFSPIKERAERLVMMQSLAGLAAILSRFSVQPAPGAPRKPTIDTRSNIVQVIRGGLPLIFTERRPH